MSIVLATCDAAREAELRAYLAPHCTVSTVSSVEALLEFSSTRSPTLILIDLRLSESKALELIQRAKRDERLKTTPRLLLGTPPAVSEWLDQGLDDYVKEPFDPDELLARVKFALRMGTEAQRKDKIIRGLAHAARTPLGAIIGWAQVLRRKNTTAEDLAKGLEIIERSARDESKAIEALMDPHWNAPEDAL